MKSMIYTISHTLDTMIYKHVVAFFSVTGSAELKFVVFTCRKLNATRSYQPIGKTRMLAVIPMPFCQPVFPTFFLVSQPHASQFGWKRPGPCVHNQPLSSSLTWLTINGSQAIEKLYKSQF